MNERIRELAEQCTTQYRDGNGGYIDQVDTEKFAKLIVRECAQYMYKHYPHSRYEINYMRKHMDDTDWNKPIEQHFGFLE